MHKPSELAKRSLAMHEEVEDGPCDCDGCDVDRSYLRLRERIGKVIYDLDRGSFQTRRIADQLRSDLEVSDAVKAE